MRIKGYQGMISKSNEKMWLKLFQSQNESQKRWIAAYKSIELGYGGIKKVSLLTGMSQTTIIKGIQELKNQPILNNEKIRQDGGGRKRVFDTDKKLISAIEKILDENTVGDPMSLLKWTCKSTRTLAEQLNKKGFDISYKTVGMILHKLKYSLQNNTKTISGKNHPNRDAQFRYINKTVKEFINNGSPVISVDTKKRELVGKFKNNGKTWRKQGDPKKVHDHDFRSLSEGIAIPYGTYDINANEGFVNVGVTSDTAEFAVNSIEQWWILVGRKRYQKSKKILICADGGGSNGSKNRLWKSCLQNLSKKLRIAITVCHYPPSTSKWNKIEHRLFSFISLNWKGVPLENYETVINLIGGTKTSTGLKVKAKLDKRNYEKKIKVPDEVFDSINIRFHKKHPQWNYTISPKK
jgi:transposase